MKIAKSRREAGFRENGLTTGFSGVFAKPHNAAKSGALEQESYVSGSSGGNFVEVQVLLSAPYRVSITDLSYGYSIFFLSTVSPSSVVSKCAFEVLQTDDENENK